MATTGLSHLYEGATDGRTDISWDIGQEPDGYGVCTSGFVIYQVQYTSGPLPGARCSLLAAANYPCVHTRFFKEQAKSDPETPQRGADCTVL